jgi:hypothetical protein
LYCDDSLFIKKVSGAAETFFMKLNYTAYAVYKQFFVQLQLVTTIVVVMIMVVVPVAVAVFNRAA